MGKKEPPFLAASTPRDVLEGKIQGIPQAVRRETNGRGIEMQTELPVTEISLDARKSVRDLLLGRSSFTSPTRRSSDILLTISSNLHI
jgi:hypothetical protein